MSAPKQYPGAFRRTLHGELQQWLTEGLVSQDVARQLEDRYALRDAVAPRIGGFAALLYGLGALLIGGGVISFIAYNWDAIPDLAKIIVALFLMILFQGVGYHWRFGPRPALGQAMLLLGTLLFGANIGLIAQVYHIPGHWSGGFGPWAFAATAIAYVTGSIPVMLLAIFAGATAFFGALGDDRTLWSYSVMVGFQTIPFALQHRSALVMVPGMLLFALGLTLGVGPGTSPHVMIAAVCVAAALFSLIAFTLRLEPNYERLGRIAQRLGGLLLLGLALLFSLGIGTLGSELSYSALTVDLRKGFGTMLVGLFAVLGLVWLGPIARQAHRQPGQIIALAAACASALLLAAIALGRLGNLAAPVGMLTLLALGLAFAWTGLTQRDRGLYYLGTFFLCSRLVFTLLFAEVNLLFKALGMVATGVALIVIALQYERWAQRLTQKDSRP